MFASVTRLRLRSAIYLPTFAWKTFLIQRQTRRTPGFVGGRLLVDVRRTFWTLTVWESDKAMKAFRGSGVHGRVMPRLAHWCDEASYAHWETQNLAVPDWIEAYEHLVSEGRLSPVAHASEDHKARRFPKPRLSPLIGGNLKPVPGAGRRS